MTTTCLDDLLHSIVDASCPPDLVSALPLRDDCSQLEDVADWIHQQNGPLWPPSKVAVALPRTLALLRRWPSRQGPPQAAVRLLLEGFVCQLENSPDPAALLQGLSLRTLQDLCHSVRPCSRRTLLGLLEPLLRPQYGAVLSLLAAPPALPPPMGCLDETTQIDLQSSPLPNQLALLEYILGHLYQGRVTQNGPRQQQPDGDTIPDALMFKLRDFI